MDAVDAYIPPRPPGGQALSCHRDVSRSPAAHRGDRPHRAGHREGRREVEIVGIKDTVKKVVTGVEMSASSSTGQAGDNAGILLRGVERKDVERGQVLAKPAASPHTKFTAQVYVLTKDEGGRHTPFFNKYRPSSTSAPPT